jgi:hypothetical protein
MFHSKHFRYVRPLVAALASCSLIGAAAPTASLAEAPCAGADALPAEVGVGATAEATRCLINGLRAQPHL